MTSIMKMRLIMQFGDLDFNNLRVLVTGGAGFVGSNIVHKLLELEAKVIVLDDFFTGRRENLPKHVNLEVIEGSVTDEALIRSMVKDMDLVIHEAARNIIISTKDPKEDCAVNIVGTLNVLLAAREAKRVKRVVYSSSVSIYGNTRYLPINEDDPINTLSPYSVSKLAGENYCKAFYESYGLATTIVRYSNVFGLGQSPTNPYCGVVSKFFESAMEGKPIQIHGDGEQTRDMSYIEDVVEATLLAAASYKAEGQTYNIGTGIETTINRLAEKIRIITGSDEEAEHIDRRDIDNIRRRVLNIEKVRRELRWIPRHTLDKGLKKTYEWLKSH